MNPPSREGNKNRLFGFFEERRWYVFASIFGGLLFLAHCVYIHHLPDLSLASLTVVFLAGALAGIFIVAILSLAFVVPGSLWQAMIVSRPTYALKPKRRIKNRAQFDVLLSFGLPMLPTVCGFVLWMLVGDSWLIRGAYWLATGFAVSLLWAFGWFLWKKLSLVRALHYLSVWALSWIFAAIPWLIVLKLTRLGLDNAEAGSLEAWLQRVLLVELVIAVIFCNIIVVGPPADMPRWIPKKGHRSAWIAIVAIATLAVFTSVTKTWWLIPESVMRVYRLGGDIDIALVVKKEGCIVAGAHKVLATPLDEGTCRLEGLKLRDRLGTEYLLMTSAKTEFTLRSSDVMSRDFPPEKEEKTE